MGQRYLTDTNVIIDYFGDKLPQNSKLFLNEIEIIISDVTKIEILGWHKASNEQLKQLYSFMDLVTILPISNEVVNQTISLRQKYRIKLADAIIAATAIANDLTLITRNTKDFEAIEGLSLINPFEISP
ncbi:MAG: type II toxin-antitoxin system VapC family toxin [Chloroherpetonaceae bacterium]